MDETAEPRPQVTPSRAALVAITALASGVGLLPYLLFIDRLPYLWVVVPGSGLLAYFALRKLTQATMHPSAMEWLLGAWSAVSKPSTGSLGGLMFYGLFYGGHRLAVAVARYFGFELGGDSSVWGFWGSIWLVGGMIIWSATDGVRVLAHQLYSREAWAHSAFFPLLARSRLIATGALAALVALAAMLWLLDPHGIALPILLSVLLFYTSFPLAELGEKGPDKSESKVVDSLVLLLQHSGYRVVRVPRTGKAEIDPLLQSIDLLAQGKERAYAVEVKAVAPNVAVEWKEATAVRTAATLLADEIVADSGSPMPVVPVLMLVGGTVAQSLEAFSQREQVPIVHFRDATDATRDQDELVRRLQAIGLVFPSPDTAPSTTA